MTRTTTKGHAMNGKKILAAIATAASLAAAAFAGTAAQSAHAATVDQLPGLGYSVTVTNLCSGFPCQANGCHDYAAAGYGVSVDIGSDCDPGFQASLDSFVAGHDERKLGYQHPAAVGARADLQTKGYAVATDYATPTFHVTGGCNIDSTVDSSGIVTIDAALPTAAPCPVQAPPTTTTSTTPSGTTPVTTTTDTPPPAGGAPTTTTTPPTDTTTTTPTCDLACLEARIAALEKNYAALAARVTAIEEANAASWQAFSDALAAGATPADAALAARSAGLNAIYQLS